MKKVLIFTGAGAPFALENPKYPTTLKFMEPYENNDYINEIKRLTNKDPIDCEDVFELLDRLLIFNDDEKIDDLMKFAIRKQHQNNQKIFDDMAMIIKETYSNLREEMRERCYESYAQKPNNEEIESLYNPLFNLFKDFKYHVYTTNYDCSFDFFLGKKYSNAEGYHPNYIDGFNGSNQWQPQLFKKVEYTCKYYKLHGSVLFHKNEDSIYSKTPLPQIGDMAYNKQFVIYPGFKDNPKLQDTIISIPHENLEQDLINIETLIFIGFAFRDGGINSSIHSSLLRKKTDYNVIIINPIKPQNLESVFPDAGKIVYIQKNFEAISKSPDDNYLTELKAHLSM